MTDIIKLSAPKPPEPEQPSTPEVEIPTTTSLHKKQKPSQKKRHQEENGEPRYWEIPILFEDEHLLVVDKPATIHAISSYITQETFSMQDFFQRDIARQATWIKQRPGLTYLQCALPLDAEATGVLVFAKNEQAKQHCLTLLGNEKNFRTFHALIHGRPQPTESQMNEDGSFRVQAGLQPHPSRPDAVKIDVKRGKKSITDFKVLDRFSGYSFLECRPVTERMMQIRAHLRYIKCPTVCDHLYHGRPLYLSSLKPKYRPSHTHDERPLMGRVALHCSRIEMSHPVTGENLFFEADLPKDFQTSLKLLRKYSR